jgi:hypothetical protein
MQQLYGPSDVSALGRLQQLLKNIQRCHDSWQQDAGVAGERVVPGWVAAIAAVTANAAKLYAAWGWKQQGAKTDSHLCSCAWCGVMVQMAQGADMEVLLGVSPHHCGGALEHFDLRGSQPLHISALGLAGLVQPGLPCAIWTGVSRGLRMC